MNAQSSSSLHAERELYGNPAIRDALLIAHPRTGGFASPSLDGFALVKRDGVNPTKIFFAIVVTQRHDLGVLRFT